MLAYFLILKQTVAVYGVRLYGLELLIRELAGFLDYLVIDAKFPYIMECSAGCSKLYLIRGHSQPLGEYVADHGYIHAVCISKVVEIAHIVEHVEHTESI